ncbi:MAG: HAD-IA family hydrolase [Eubacteriales bacterium]
MSGKKVVIFDLDGTLLDTLCDLGDSVNRMLERFGFPTHTYDEIKNMVGNGARRLALNAIPYGEKNERAEECVSYFLSHYDDGQNKKTKPFKGIPEAIDTLKAHGIMTAVVTNKLDAVAKSLCKQFFGDRFDIVLGDRADMRRKPYPDGVFYVMEQLGCSRGVYVGDADTDIEVAKNANIPSVSVSWGFRDREFLTSHGASVIVDDAQALLNEIGRALGENFEKKSILPEKFKRRMIDLLGADEAASLFSAIEEKDAVKAFRVNRIKIDVESFEAANPQIDRRKVDFPPDAYLTGEEFPGSLACHHSGAIYVQDISAMSTVCAVDVPNGACVLDCCSAPGGKTSQLAAAVGESGVVVANEYDKKRCRVLQGNIERMGAKNTVVCNLDTAVLAEVYPEKFDLVLCDAPCSGEGMFRKNPRAIEEWSEENVKMCMERQREILTNVAKCVKPGGLLLYSTCTFSIEENEGNVAWFLLSHKDFELADVCDGLEQNTSNGIMLDSAPCVDMTKCRRIYPHKSLGEGQFIALFRKENENIDYIKPIFETKKNEKRSKREGKDNLKAKYSLNKAEMLCANEFLKKNLVSVPDGELISLGNMIYLSPKIELPEYNVVSAGVCIGECQKGRILPHHQLFSAFGADFKLKIRLSSDSDAAKRYLRGEEIAVEGLLDSAVGEQSGWAAVLIDGCSVGGAKVSGGVAKNHYPKGLRN